MKHIIYANGEEIYSTKYKFLCNIIFDLLKPKGTIYLTMISDYTKGE